MYLLLGYGKSNKSIEKYLIKQKIKYLIYDDIKFNNNIDLKKVSLIIKSNGISNDHKIIKEAKNKKIKIISDLQYFYYETNINNYCLVTGSNGKTTIVSLLEKTLNNTISIGNNGLAFFDYINDNKYKVLEVSSFMLETISFINYKYNIITNIYPTHLEHHSNYINYIKSKLSFLKHLSTNNYVIYNKDDILLNRIINNYDFHKVSVSLKDHSSTIYLKENYIYYKTIKILNIKMIKLIGKHNIYNIMLVLGLLLNHPLKKPNYKKEIYNYLGEKYRLQLIYNNKFKIINDSKSTNFKALKVALESFNENIILIVGGMKRNDDYKLLNKELDKIKVVYCYGENKDDFYNYFINNKIECYKYDSLEEVIKNIKIINNHILLFSPGSISHDQFKDFEERGEVFNRLIKENILLKSN